MTKRRTANAKSLVGEEGTLKQERLPSLSLHCLTDTAPPPLSSSSSFCNFFLVVCVCVLPPFSFSRYSCFTPINPLFSFAVLTSLHPLPLICSPTSALPPLFLFP